MTGKLLIRTSPEKDGVGGLIPSLALYAHSCRSLWCGETGCVESKLVAAAFVLAMVAVGTMRCGSMRWYPCLRFSCCLAIEQTMVSIYSLRYPLSLDCDLRSFSTLSMFRSEIDHRPRPAGFLNSGGLIWTVVALVCLLRKSNASCGISAHGGS